MFNTHRTRLATLIVLVLVVVGLLSQSATALPFRKLFLPVTMNSSVGFGSSQDLRIDHIPLSSLDQALRDFGIADATFRAQLYNDEVARRNGGGAAPEGYPSPESEVEIVSNVWMGCQAGMGCLVKWKSTGLMRSAFREFSGQWQEWSPGIPCPITAWCIVISKTRPTIHDPVIRRWVEFAGSSFEPAQFIAWFCQFNF